MPPLPCNPTPRPCCAVLPLLPQAKEAQHAADQRRLAQHYQTQLAAAEGEIQRARAEGVRAGPGAGGGG